MAIWDEITTIPWWREYRWTLPLGLYSGVCVNTAEVPTVSVPGSRDVVGNLQEDLLSLLQIFWLFQASDDHSFTWWFTVRTYTTQRKGILVDMAYYSRGDSAGTAGKMDIHTHKGWRDQAQVCRSSLPREVCMDVIFCPAVNRKDAYKVSPLGFPGGAAVKKNPPANTGEMGSSPGLGRSHMPRSN